MYQQTSSYNTQTTHKPRSCTCSAVFNQLHFEWDHGSSCEWSVEREIEENKQRFAKNIENQERAMMERVQFAVKRGKSHTVSLKLLKKYAPEAYAELSS